jgi:hypothetical protein
MSDSPEVPKRPTLQLLRGELEGAPEQVPPAFAGAGSAPPETPADYSPGRAGPPRGRPDRAPGEIWPGCPVKALGVHGSVYFYLDLLNQLAAVEGHTKDRMRGVFGGRSDLLMSKFPQYSRGETPSVIGWKQEDCATAMMRAATEKGIWNAYERVRGLGAWPDGAGGAILHCGDGVLIGGRWQVPGEHDGYVYPGAGAIPRPVDETASHDTPAADLVDLLATWKWSRGEIDAWLLLGWVCGAMFAGALDWRPLVWITGDAGTGKSTLQKLLVTLLGGERAVLASSDPTEAAIRQFLAAHSQSTIPVILDEMEAEESNQRVNALIKLARQAASGGVVLRGSTDHKGHEFRIRSTFLFSSILVPPLLDQDISRIALLELMELPRDVVPPRIDPKRWGRVGQALARLVIERWGRLADTLAIYRAALARAGHNARGCDQLGTLLAMADMAYYPDPPDADRADTWAKQLSAEDIVDQTDMSRDWQRMLNHLLGQHIEPFRSGQRYSVGRWVRAAAGLEEAPQPHDARSALPSYGLRVEGRGDAARLVVANSHPMLAQLFANTRWYSGSASRGVWAQACKRVPGSTATKAIRFDGVASRAWSIPLPSIPGLFGEDAPGGAQNAERVPSLSGDPSSPDHFV